MAGPVRRRTRRVTPSHNWDTANAADFRRLNLPVRPVFRPTVRLTVSKVKDYRNVEQPWTKHVSNALQLPAHHIGRAISSAIIRPPGNVQGRAAISRMNTRLAAPKRLSAPAPKRVIRIRRRRA